MNLKFVAMKKFFCLALALAGLTLSASAALYNYSWNVNTAIPDANSSGIVNNQIITDGLQGNNLPTGPSLASVVGVSLTLSGGWNGDLYAYLRYEKQGEGVGFTTLLNRVGTSLGNPIGSTAAGFNNIFLTADSGLDIHSVLNPSANTTYRVDQTGTSVNFDSFVGLDPTGGTWSLFFADRSGQHVSTLNSWGLTLEVVPEPANVALAIFGGIGGIVGLWRWRTKRS